MERDALDPAGAATGECVCCDIVAGTEPASLAYEDETIVAFMDTGPVNPGHLLVVPRQHYPYLTDMGEATGARLFLVTMRLAGAVRRLGLRCEGVNLFLADGEAAFQEIFYLHMHVFPRSEGDDYRLSADWTVRPLREDLDAAAATIRSALNAPSGAD